MEARKTSRAEQRDKSTSTILSTAIALFGERGYAGVSLDEVAAAAGVRRTLVLYYFKSKDELWRTAARQVSAAFNKALTNRIARVSAASGEERLRATLAASLDAFLEEPDFPRFLVREGGTQNERLDWLVGHFDYAEVGYGSEAFKAYVGTTIMRDTLFAILLSMAALGPLMEASLSRVSGRRRSGIYPMSRGNRKELVALMTRFVLSLEKDG